jgi:serine/threonine protein kinase
MPILTPRERLGSLLAGRYRLDGILAIGGMSIVFEGIDLRSRRPVAVKLIKSDAALEGNGIERFLQETRLTVDLRHPHVVEVLDFGEDSANVPYLVMELLRGESLETALERSATLRAEEILRLLLPIMGALASAHAAGVVHRDVKPGNIFLSVDPRGGLVPKLIDFGIAKSRESTLETKVGAVLGTPEYMAPEQLTGAEATAETDVWAIGAVLYRSASGLAPYAGVTSSEVLAKLARDLVPPLCASGFPIGFCAAIDRALSRDPTQRYRSIRELAAALIITAREAGLDVPSALETSAGVDGFDWTAVPGVRTLSATLPGTWRAGSRWRTVALALGALGAAAWLGHSELSDRSADAGGARRLPAADRQPASEGARPAFEHSAPSHPAVAVGNPPGLDAVAGAPVVGTVLSQPDAPSRPRRQQPTTRLVAPSGPAPERTLSGGEFPLATEW